MILGRQPVEALQIAYCANLVSGAQPPTIEERMKGAGSPAFPCLLRASSRSLPCAGYLA